MSSDIAVEVNHLWKRFHRGEFHDCLRDAIPALVKSMFVREKRDKLGKGDFWALQDVSFQVKKGEAFAIIGHNGAGKSTMLKVLSNLLLPNRGYVKTRGRLRALIEVGAGFHGDLTGRENIYLNGSILGMTQAEINAKFDEIVEFSGIEDFLDTPVKRYSSGMRARLGFSVAANLEPEILIVDEVLSVGDAEFQKKCIEKMTSVIRGGRTVLFVSHNMNAVRNLCSRAILLEHGQLIAEGDTESVLQRYIGSAKSYKEQDVSERTDRVGTGEAVITKFQIGLNPDFMGQECICNFGEGLYIKVRYRANADVPQPYITPIFVSNKFSIDTAQVTTDIAPVKLSDMKAGEEREILFHIPQVLCAPGSYLFNCAIKKAPDTLVDKIWNLASLEISRDNDMGFHFEPTHGSANHVILPFEYHYLS